MTAAQRQVVSAAGLGRLLRCSGDALGVSARHGLALRLTDDSELQSLNERFAGSKQPTDVLAFPSDAPETVGDIAISVERAMAQGTEPVAELRLLAVHGLLHCLGFDHHRRDDAERMVAETRRLLRDQRVPAL